MKRYLIFAGDRFYPSGGWKDFKQSCETVEDALVCLIDVLMNDGADWYQIIDSVTAEIVKEG